MNRILFTTFADGNWGLKEAAKRISNQAQLSGLFGLGNKIQNLKTLYSESPNFYNRNAEFISSTKKGFGNYLWKPQVILNALEEVADDEFILYLDSGCQFNINERSLVRFESYVEMASVTGAVLMQLRDGSFGANSLSDASWTKASTLQLLDPHSAYRYSAQIQSGIILMKKTSETLHFVNTWLQNCELQDYQYLKSPESKSEIQLGHRWEQSIMSLMVKSSTKFALVEDETYWAPSWTQGKDYPIWAMRNRTGGDAYRRNVGDLTRIALAKISRI